ncbi:MAG TPA: 3-oxoacyl-ACP reductase FabG [Alphaproteobacteria bacterium]|nr:3-oxoacyl-ACP reductase FabG [Alphaproteobacteria bacterium]
MRLKDRIAIVTGADSGIGQGIAEAFAQEGADIAFCYRRDADGAAETVRRIEAAGRRALSLQADLRDPAAIAMLFERTAAELGTPDILVNNAGIGSNEAPIAEASLEEWEDVLRTDLTAPFLCCQHFVRQRQAAGGRGRIINITSVHEAIPSPKNLSYGAAKGGLLTFTRSLALELAAQRINVNAIAPGLIHTPMTAERVEDPAQMAEQLPNIPWRRPGRPWEVGRLAAYLASDDADYITGQSFTIDGGLEMNWGQGA